MARAAARVSLGLSRTECERRKKAAATWCKQDRKRIRGERDDVVEAEKRARRAERKDYTKKKGRGRTPRHSGAESDSLAELNIDPVMIPIWRELRASFPYDRTPDDRAVLFGEWVEEHPEQVASMLADAYEIPDHDLRAAEEAAWRAEQGIDPSTPLDDSFDVEDLEDEAATVEGVTIRASMPYRTAGATDHWFMTAEHPDGGFAIAEVLEEKRFDDWHVNWSTRRGYASDGMPLEIREAIDAWVKGGNLAQHAGSLVIDDALMNKADASADEHAKLRAMLGELRKYEKALLRFEQGKRESYPKSTGLQKAKAAISERYGDPPQVIDLRQLMWVEALRMNDATTEATGVYPPRHG